MLSIEDKEIIERCLTVSMLNYKLGKCHIVEDTEGIQNFEIRLESELKRLRALVSKDLIRSSSLTKTEEKVVNKKDGFLKRTIARWSGGFCL